MFRLMLIGFLFLSNTPVMANGGRDLGVGVTLFDPSGLTMKKWLDKTHAFDAAIGWGSEYVYLHANYLIHELAVVREGKVTLDLYYGIGGRFIDRDDNNKNDDKQRLGIRIPGGAEVFFRSTRLGVFGEVALLLDLIEETSTGAGVSIGVRYYIP